MTPDLAAHIVTETDTVLLVGTLDTKGAELQFVAERLEALGCRVLTVDVGVLGHPCFAADISRNEVAVAAGASVDALAAAGDRGAAIETMARGGAIVVRALFAERRFSAAMAIGGSGGASIAATALGVLPVGVPKLIVSTVVAGDTRPFIGDADFTLMYPVVDIAGINSFSERVLSNAAAAIAGMAKARWPVSDVRPGRPVIGLTMFGITTPCVDRVRHLLALKGYDSLVFSANGIGGQSMERLIHEGQIGGVVDITTTEFADLLVGGICPATDRRLEAAGDRGIPQVLSVGGLDVVNFGPWDTVPQCFRDRKLYRHNSAVTLMRTSATEAAELGRMIGAKLAQGRGRRCIVLPLRGLSSLSAPGKPFHDPEADQALFSALRGALPESVEVVELDTDINDPAVAAALAEHFDAAYRSTAAEQHAE